MDIVELGIRVTSESVDKANRRLEEMPHAAGLAEKSVDSLTGSIRSFALQTAALVGLGTGIRDIIGIWSQTQDIDLRIKNLTKTAESFAETQEYLISTARQYSQDITALKSGYASYLNLVDGGLITTQRAREFTEGFSVATRALGASTDQLANVNYGLSQALASGVVRAEEFNQVMEPLPGLLQAVERANGMTSGSLRKLVNDGQITSDMFSDYLSKGLETFKGNSEGAAETISGASARMRTEWTLFVNQFNDGATVITSGINEVANFMRFLNEEGGNLNGIFEILTLGAGIFVSRGLGPMIASTATATTTMLANAEAASVARAADLAQAQAKEAVTSAALAEAKAMQANIAEMAIYGEVRAAANRQVLIATEAHTAAAAAVTRATLAIEANSIAARTNTLAQEAMAIAGRAASGALALVGGPVGAAMLAATAIYMFATNSKSASEQAQELRGEVDKLATSFRNMGKEQLVVAQFDIKKDIGNAQQELQAANARVESLNREARYSKDLGKFNEEYARAKAASAEASSRLAEREKLLADVGKQLSDINNGVVKSTNDSTKASSGLAQATGALSKEEQKAQDSLNRKIEGIIHETATLKMSSVEQELYKLKLEGATEAQLEAIRPMLEAQEAHKSTSKTVKDHAKDIEDLAKKQTDLNASLKEQIATFGMSSAESRRWKAENEKLLTAENEAQLKKLEALEQEEEQRKKLWELDKQLSEQFISDIEYATQAQIEQADKLNQAYGDVFNSLAGSAASFFNSLGKGKIDIGGILSQGASGLQSAAISGMTEAVKGGGIDALFKTGGGNFISEALGGLSGLLSNSSSSMLQSAGGLLGKGASWAATMSPLTSGLLGFAAPIALDAITNLIGNMGAGPYSGKGFKVSGSLQDFQLAALTQNNKGSKTDILDTSAGTFGKWNISDVLSGGQSLGQDQLKTLLGVEDTIKAFGKGLTENIDFIGKAFGQDLATNFSENFDASLNIEGENFENALSVWLQETGGKAIDFARDNIDTSKLDEAGKLLFEISSAFDFNADAMRAAKGAIDGISTTFDMLEIDASMLNSALVEASGGLASLQSSLNFFYQEFTSVDEKLADETDKAQEALSKLGAEFPKTRAEFNALYKGNQDLIGGLTEEQLRSIDTVYDAQEKSAQEAARESERQISKISQQEKAYDTATSAQENYIDSLMKGAESLNDWIMQQLTGSDSAATFSQQFQLAQAEFNRVSSMGSQASAQDLQRSAETLLQLNRQGFGARGAGLEAQVLSQVQGIAAGMGGGSNEAVVALLQQLLDATQSGNADNSRQLRRMSDTRRRS